MATLPLHEESFISHLFVIISSLSVLSSPSYCDCQGTGDPIISLFDNIRVPVPTNGRFLYSKMVAPGCEYQADIEVADVSAFGEVGLRFIRNLDVAVDGRQYGFTEDLKVLVDYQEISTVLPYDQNQVSITRVLSESTHIGFDLKFCQVELQWRSYTKTRLTPAENPDLVCSGYPTVSRGDLDGWNVLTLIDKAHRITAATQVTEVKFYASRTNGKIFVGIYRRVGTSNTFNVVRSFEVPVNTVGVNTIDVSDKSMFAEAGDYYGFTHTVRSVIPFSRETGQKFWHAAAQTNKAQGTTVQMYTSNDQHGKRSYSIKWCTRDLPTSTEFKDTKVNVIIPRSMGEYSSGLCGNCDTHPTDNLYYSNGTMIAADNPSARNIKYVLNYGDSSAK